MVRRTPAAAGRRRAAQTLLEMIAATTVIAIAVVPALSLMRDSIRVGRETEMANLLATLSASMLEDHLVITARSWSTATLVGDFSADGYPQVRFQVVRSDSIADGGMVGSLMSVVSTVWEDQNANASWDAGEPRAVFASKLARNVAYENEAAGT